MSDADKSALIGRKVRINWDPFDRGKTGEVGTVVDANYSSVVGWAVVVKMDDGDRFGYPERSLEWLADTREGQKDG